MIIFNKNCIFCYSLLTSTSKRDGEHVIPKNIFGFWRIYDICEECKKYFGDKIDHLAINNVNILNAMHTLKIPNAEKYYDNLKYYGTDTLDGHKVKMVRKKGKFRNKVRIINNNFLECSESDLEILGLNWLRKNLKDKFPEATIEKEIDRLKNEYKKTSPGETIHSKLLDYSIRKKQKMLKLIKIRYRQ